MIIDRQTPNPSRISSATRGEEKGEGGGGSKKKTSKLVNEMLMEFEENDNEEIRKEVK
jgi:hypothetical protein